MQDPEIQVTYSAVEAFSRRLLRPGVLPLEDGRAKAWLDKTFQTVISQHGWHNYLTMFIHEHEKFLAAFAPGDVRAMSAEWFARQISAPERRHWNGTTQ